MRSLRQYMLVSALIVVFCSPAAGQQGNPVGDEIRLGVPTDLSGPVASNGVSTTNGVRMRVAEINKAGGINGRKVKLIVEDTQYSIPLAVQSVSKLLRYDRVFATISSVGTSINLATLPRQFALGVPSLFPIASARQLYTPINRLSFFIVASNYSQTRAGLKYLVESKGRKTVCAMYQDTDYGNEIGDGARDEAKAMGVTFGEATTHKATDQDFTAQLIKLKAAGCQVVAMGTIVRDTIIAYSAARRMGWTDVDFMTTSGPYDQTVAGAQAGVTEGLYATAIWQMPYRDAVDAKVVKWMNEYKAEFNVEPNLGSIWGYVSMDLSRVGLERAGHDLTVANFINAMDTINDYQDIFGGPKMSFSRSKRQGSTTVFLAQVKNGRWTRVTPGEISY